MPFLKFVRSFSFENIKRGKIRNALCRVGLLRPVSFAILEFSFFILLSISFLTFKAAASYCVVTPPSEPGGWGTIECYLTNICNGSNPPSYCNVTPTKTSGDAIPSHIWVRVLSRENGVTKSWKGSQQNDPVWNNTNNPGADLFAASWSIDPANGGGLDANGNFKRYVPVYAMNGGGSNPTSFAATYKDNTPYAGINAGNAKNWDINKNKIDPYMNLYTDNIISPYSNERTPLGPVQEYWATHWCFGGLMGDYDPSNPPYMKRSSANGPFCAKISRNQSDPTKAKSWCYPDTDGCPTTNIAGTGSSHSDWYANFVSLQDKAIKGAAIGSSYSRGSTSWMNFAYDGAWSLSLAVMSETKTKFILAPPDGYKCIDVRWWADHQDSPQLHEEEINKNFRFGTNPTGGCVMDRFYPESDGNLMVFEIAPKAFVTVGGKVVNNSTGVGVPWAQVNITRRLPSGNFSSPNTVTADANGIYRLNNFVREGDEYTITPLAINVAGLGTTAFAVNSNHVWGTPTETGTYIGWSWDVSISIPGTTPRGDTKVGDPDYSSQQGASNVDCSGPDNAGNTFRCWFAVDTVIPPPPPSSNFVAGYVKLKYNSPAPVTDNMVRYDESGFQFQVEIQRNGIWYPANWNWSLYGGCTGTNYPNGSTKPSCSDYFTSQTNFNTNELTAVRIKLPSNKYTCSWDVTWNLFDTQWIGTWGNDINQTNGYCTTSTFGISGTPTLPNPGIPVMQSNNHVNFHLAYKNSRVTGMIFDQAGNVINPGLSNMIVQTWTPYIFSTAFYPSYTYDAAFRPYFFFPGNSYPQNGDFISYLQDGDVFTFSIDDKAGAYRCNWMYENSGSTSLRSSFAAFGAGFNPNDLNTYPASALKGSLSNCNLGNVNRIPARLTAMSPVYSNNLYIFRIDNTSRYSGRVFVEYKALNGVVGTQWKDAIRDPSLGFQVYSGNYNTSTGVSTFNASINSFNVDNIFARNCTANYPDNITVPNCNDFYVSKTTYANGVDAVAKIIYPTDKYDCMWSDPNGVVHAGADAHITAEPAPNVGYSACTAWDGGNNRIYHFTPGKDLSGLSNISTEWPSKINFYLSFKKNSASATIFNHTTLSGGYTMTGNTYTATSNVYNGLPYYVVTPNPANGWLPNSGGSLTIGNTNAATDVCYYHPTYNAVIPGAGVDVRSTLSYTFDQNVFNNTGTTYSNPITLSCSNIPFNFQSGIYSPLYHNQLTVFVAPRVNIGPSTVSLVNSAAECNTAGTLISGRNVGVNLSSSDGLLNANTSTNSGTFSFANTLDYRKNNYSITVTSVAGVNMGDLTLCPPQVPPTPTGAYTSNSGSGYAIHLQALFAGYPNVSTGQFGVPFRFYLKETNKWWQVYNGGVHTNAMNLTFSMNGAGGEGMPIGAVLVGDPSAPLNTNPNLHPLGVGYNVGGLVSPHLTNLPNNAYGLPPRNYGVAAVNTKIMNPYNMTKIMTAVQSWPGNTVTNDIGTAFISPSKYVWVNSSNVDSASIQYDSLNVNKVIVIGTASGNSTLNINANMIKEPSSSGKGIPIIIVNGNVNISPAVTNIRAVIYASGAITLNSAGDDLDLPIIVTGGLYAGAGVVFNRDLPNNFTYYAQPADQVLYAPEIFNYMGNIGKSGQPGVELPADFTESVVYWEVE